MSDFEHLDYYELLGVSRSASLDEIKRAYRREISKYHPDRFVKATPEEQAYGSQRSQRLTEAYGILSDFTARTAYNRGQAQAAPTMRPRAAPAAPPQPRDHKAELYEQAQQHLEAGRLLQAIGALRQLQQINPFYRDSATLLSSLEAQVNQRQASAERRRPRLLLLGSVAGGVVLIAVAAWAIGMRSPTAGRRPASTSAPVAIGLTQQATRPPEPTAAPATLDATPEPAASPTPAAAEATPAPATAEPTIDFPTVTATSAPAATPTLAGEGGALIAGDSFSQSSWANQRGNGWQVGYQAQRYRISANRGLGTIWSFRSTSLRDFSMGVDLQVASGEAGLLLRFQDANNYLSVSLNPSSTSYRVEQHDGGETLVLGGGQSEAILAGADAINRLVVRISGSHLQILANGQSLAELDAPGAPTSTRYGLLVIANDSAADAFFDNLAIRRLE